MAAGKLELDYKLDLAIITFGVYVLWATFAGKYLG